MADRAVKLAFTEDGWTRCCHWVEHTRTMRKRINELIKDSKRHPCTGIGNPEPLRNEHVGWWSRHLTKEHRRAYRVTGKQEGQTMEIAACHFHD